MINPQDETELRGLLYLPDEADLPTAVAELYLKVQKIRNRRYAAPMSLDLLCMIVIQAGCLPDGPAKVADTPWHVGDEVEVFRGDCWQPAKIKGLHKKNGVQVAIEGDEAPFRVIKPQNIRVLEHA